MYIFHWGGGRVSKGRWAFNIAVVWTLTGLWHGAAWNYIAWGIYYGTLLIVEKLFLGRLIGRLPFVFQHCYTVLIFIFGWTFFWITDTEQLIQFWKAMMGVYGASGKSTMWQLEAWGYSPVFIACIAASIPLAPWIKERFCSWAEERATLSILHDGVANTRHIWALDLCVFDIKPATKKKAIVVQVTGVLYDMCLVALFLLSMASVISGSFNPFIYFQF